MKITFLIGNGFDIGLGMKTRFQDMYGPYVSNWTGNQNIMGFKNELRRDAPKYETWGDFEMGMAKYALKCNDESSLIECLRDFKGYMVGHLMQEEKSMLDRIKLSDAHEKECAEIMTESLHSFYKAQSQNTIAEVEQYKGARWEYNFITFNYTRVFDYLLNCYRLHFNPHVGSPIHIHGTLGQDVVLGIDNEMQLQGVDFPISKKLKRAFVKPYFNENFDSNRVETAVNTIMSSDVICVYGMSLGESDLSWTRLLVEWLKQRKCNMLFYFQYSSEKYNPWDRDLIMDVEDEKKEQLLRRITNSPEELEEIFDQVHIPIAYDIFDFMK